jgi:hypothetical protein
MQLMKLWEQLQQQLQGRLQSQLAPAQLAGQVRFQRMPLLLLLLLSETLPLLLLPAVEP